MKFVRFDGDRLGLLTADGDGIVDLTDRLGLGGRDPLLDYLRAGHDASDSADEVADVATADVRLESPVRRPGKVVAAARNYREHVEEMTQEYGYDDDYTVRDSGFFLKAPSSIVGPADEVVLPYTDRRFDYELELAYVMGETIVDATVEEAWDAIAGYTILIDVTMRGDEDRPRRKSFDTFTVVGPNLTAASAIDDPMDLDMELRLNGEVRQNATTAQMIYDCGEFTAISSDATTVEVGDLFTTGTPSGVGELAEGDTITAAIEGIGEMSIGVRERGARHADAGVKA